MGFSEFSEIRSCTRWETILLKLFLQPVSLSLDQFLGVQITSLETPIVASNGVTSTLFWL